MKGKETLEENDFEETAREVDMALRYVEVFQPNGFQIVWDYDGEHIQLVIKSRRVDLVEFLRLRGELQK